MFHEIMEVLNIITFVAVLFIVAFGDEIVKLVIRRYEIRRRYEIPDGVARITGISVQKSSGEVTIRLDTRHGHGYFRMQLHPAAVAGAIGQLSRIINGPDMVGPTREKMTIEIADAAIHLELDPPANE